MNQGWHYNEYLIMRLHLMLVFNSLLPFRSMRTVSGCVTINTTYSRLFCR